MNVVYQPILFMQLFYTYEAKLVVTKSLQLDPANIVRLPNKYIILHLKISFGYRDWKDTQHTI